MINIINFRDPRGGMYEVPETELDVFKKEVPDAVRTISFKSESGKMYAVPETEVDSFSQKVPDARPALLLKLENGGKFGVPLSDVKDFYDWYRKSPETEADRKAIATETKKNTPAIPDESFLGNVVSNVKDNFTGPMDVSSIKKGSVLGGIQTGLMDMIGATSRTLASLTTTPLGRAFDFYADKLGLAGEDRKTAFGRWTEGIKEAGEQFGLSADELAGEQGSVGKVIRGVNQGVGSLAGAGPIYSVASPILGMATLPILSAMEATNTGDAKEVAKAAVSGLMLQGAMTGFKTLPRVARMTATGTTFGASTLAQGGSLEDAVSSAIFGAGLAASGGKGSSKEFKSNIKDAFKGVTESRWYKKASAKAKGEVFDDIEFDVSRMKAKGMSEGQIIRNLKRKYGTGTKEWVNAWEKHGGGSADNKTQNNTYTASEVEVWAKTHPEEALKMASKPQPTRKDFEKVGLSRVSAQERELFSSVFSDMREEIAAAAVSTAERREFKRQTSRNKAIEETKAKKDYEETKSLANQQKRAADKLDYDRKSTRIERALKDFDEATDGLPEDDSVIADNQEIINGITQAIKDNNAGRVVELTNKLTKKIRNRKSTLNKKQKPSSLPEATGNKFNDKAESTPVKEEGPAQAPIAEPEANPVEEVEVEPKPFKPPASLVKSAHGKKIGRKGVRKVPPAKGKENTEPEIKLLSREAELKKQFVESKGLTAADLRAMDREQRVALQTEFNRWYADNIEKPVEKSPEPEEPQPGDPSNMTRVKLDQQAAVDINKDKQKFIDAGVDVNMVKAGDVIKVFGYKGVNLKNEIEKRAKNPAAKAKIGRKGVKKKASPVAKDSLSKEQLDDISVNDYVYYEAGGDPEFQATVTKVYDDQLIVDTGFGSRTINKSEVKKTKMGEYRKRRLESQKLKEENDARAEAERKASEKAQAKAAMLGDKTVTSPAGEKLANKGTLTGKEQKKYLVTEIDKAIEEAPSQSDADKKEFFNPIAEARERTSKLIKDKKAMYGPHSSDVSTARNAMLTKKIKDLYTGAKEKVGTVTIEVPGDGTFEILNTKESLADFKKKAKKFPVSINSKKKGEVKNPSSVAALPKKRPEKREDIEKHVGLAVSTDEKRLVLNESHLNGETGELVATDGRRLYVALGVDGETTQHINKEDNANMTYPNYAHVIRGYKKRKLPAVMDGERSLTVNTAYLLSKMNQVKALTKNSNDVEPVIYLYENSNGTVEVGWTHPDIGEYRSGDLSDSDPIGAFSLKHLYDNMAFLRRMGNDDVKIVFSDNNNPFKIVGAKEYSVLMPLQLTNASGKLKHQFNKTIVSSPGKNASGALFDNADSQELDTSDTPPPKIGRKGRRKKEIAQGFPQQQNVDNSKPGKLTDSQKKTYKDLVKPVDIINLIKKDWPEVTIKGKATFNKPGYAGWYHSDLKTIRSKDSRSTRTILHELGHHFDNQLQNWSNTGGNIAGISSELTAMGKALYGKKKPTGGYKQEGFAEFVRMYITSNPILEGKAPRMYKWFAEYLENNPKDSARVKRLTDMVGRMQLQTPEENIRAFRSPAEKDWSLKRLLSQAQSWVDDNMRDSNLIYKRVLKEAGIEAESVDKDPYSLAIALSQIAPKKTESAVMTGTTDIFGVKTGESLFEAKKAVSAMGIEAEENFWDYMIARRSVDLHKREINPGISLSDAESFISKHDSVIFRDAATRVSEWSERVLSTLVDSGFITKDELSEIVKNNPIYVPFSRRFAKGEIRGGNTKSSRGLYKIKGSSREIKHPLDALIWQTEKIYTVAAQSMVKKSVVDIFNKHANNPDSAQYLGKFLNPVPAPVKPVTFSSDQIKKIMMGKAAEVGEEQAAKEIMDAWDDLLTVFIKSNQYTGKDHITSITVDGVKNWYEVTPEFYNALEGLKASSSLKSPFWESIRTLSKGSVSLARLGATGLNPGFGLVRNFLRDDVTTFVTGDYKTRVPLFSNLYGVLEEAFANNDMTLKYEAMGVSLSGWFGQDSRNTKKLKGKSSATNLLKKSIVEISHPVDLARHILGATEAGPRFAEFKSAYHSVIARGGSEKEATITATIAANDVSVNFKRSGYVSREANLAVMFLNAGVQSIDKLGRSFKYYHGKKNIPKATLRTIVRAGSWITFMSLISYFKNRDKQWWQELSPYEKWGYTHWDIAGKKIRIPQAFEFGMLFGSMPMAMLEEQRNPGAIKEWWHEFRSRANMISMPQLIAPLVDVWRNEDWKGSNIVNPFVMRSRDKTDWYDGSTTGLAIKTCKLLDQLTGIKMSPAQVEHVVNGYTGGIYRRMASSLDDIKDPSSMTEPSNLPVVGTLFLRDGTSRVTNDFYERTELLRQKKGSGKADLKEVGELRLSEKLSGELSEKWSERRDLIDLKDFAKTKDDILNITEDIQKSIREHNKQDFLESGIRASVFKLTDKDVEEKDLKYYGDLVNGVERKKMFSSLKAEYESRYKVHNPNKITKSGRLTAYGKRVRRLGILLKD